MKSYRLMPPPVKVAKRDEGLLKAYIDLRKKTMQLALLIFAEAEKRKYHNNLVITNPVIKEMIRENIGEKGGLELVCEPSPRLGDYTVAAKRSTAWNDLIQHKAAKLVFAIAGYRNGTGPDELLTKRELAQLRREGTIHE